MLDMGFLPDIRKSCCVTCPAKRQTLFFSATMPSAIVALTRELLRAPVTINLIASRRRRWDNAGRVPGEPQLKPPAAPRAPAPGRHGERTGFHAYQAPCRTGSPTGCERQGVRRPASTATAARASGLQALDGFRAGRFAVLVATDIAARGIDVEALGHVVNFDVPGGERGLHPPRGPHRAGGADRRGLHLRGPGGRVGLPRDRAGDRQAAAARPAARLRRPATAARGLAGARPPRLEAAGPAQGPAARGKTPSSADHRRGASPPRTGRAGRRPARSFGPAGAGRRSERSVEGRRAAARAGSTRCRWRATPSTRPRRAGWATPRRSDRAQLPGDPQGGAPSRHRKMVEHARSSSPAAPAT